MPTTAKLVAAILLAALGWFAAGLVVPYLQDGRQVGLFAPVAAGFGGLVGWFFTGRRLAGGRGSAPGIGIASVMLMIFWVSLSFSIYEMTMRSLSRRYDGPIEALQGMVEIAIEDLRLAAKPDVIAVLLLGGFVAGSLTQWAARRFR